MGNVKNYIVFFLVTAWYHLQAQTPIAAGINDSVFNASALSFIPLKDIFTGRIIHVASPGVKLSLFAFLSPECPLCQNYTPALNKLATQYASKVRVYGIIPGKAYDAATIKTFREKYKITYPLLTDPSFRLSRLLHASITPEVVLLNDHSELVYKGAVDDWLKALGKMKTKITSHYLEDAIARYPDKATIKRTKAVGCLINDQ